MKLVFFLLFTFIFAQTLFQKLIQDASNHPIVAKTAGVCRITRDPPEDVKANYLYYFCNYGSGSWKNFDFYLLYSMNPTIRNDYGRESFCLEGHLSPRSVYINVMKNISSILWC